MFAKSFFPAAYWPQRYFPGEGGDGEPPGGEPGLTDRRRRIGGVIVQRIILFLIGA